MARAGPEASDYLAVRSAGLERVEQLAADLLGSEVTLMLKDKGLLTDGVLDSLSDLAPEVLAQIFADAVGEPGIGMEYEWAILIRSAAEPAQRRRRLFARAPAEVGALWPVALGIDLSAAALPAAAEAVPPPPSSGRAPRWATRSVRRRGGAAADVPLAEAEARERGRWALAAAEILMEAKLPAAELAGRVLGGSGALKAVFGGRRLRTLRLRVRGLRRVLRWIAAAGLGGFPRGDEGVRAVLAYVSDLVASRSARSAPGAALHALKFFEVRGGVREDLQVSGNPLVVGAVAEAVTELAREASRPSRKAPAYPVAVVQALERHVLDETVLPYVRVFAWLRLVLIWASCRSDDLIRVVPSEVQLDDGVLEVRLRQTKTTGPGKRVEVAFAWVGPGSWVECPTWLAEGFALFRRIASDQDRDYLIPLPTPDLRGCRRVAADYPRLLEMGRALLVDLRAKSGTPLLHPVAALMWSEHSGRSVLPTWGAALGEGADSLDRLGRWSDSRSAGYVRANRAILTGIQSRIASGVRAFENQVLVRAESDLLAAVRDFLGQRGRVGADVDAQLAALEVVPSLPAPIAAADGGAPDSSDAPRLPSPGVSGGPSFAVVPGGVSSGGLPPSSSGGASGSEVGSVPTLPAGTLVVAVVGRARRRTLHRLPGCGRRPGVSFREFEVLERAPVATDYTDVCRQCWPSLAASAPRSTPPRASTSSSSSASGSSESSTSSDDGGADEWS